MGLTAPNIAPEIETARLLLRPFRREDFPSLCRLWSRPEVAGRILGRPASPDEVWARLLRYLGLWPLLGFGYWAVTLKATGAHIGDAGIADFHRPLMPPSLVRERQAGFSIRPFMARATPAKRWRPCLPGASAATQTFQS